MNDSDDSDDLSFWEKLVRWLITKRVLPRSKWGFVVGFLVCGPGLWYLYDNSGQSIEEIRSSAVNHMEKIYQLSKCETDWLYNIDVSKVDFEDEQTARELEQMSGENVEQKRRAMLSWRRQQEGNLGQGISATKELLKEIERLSMQIADIWKPGVALGFRCIE